MRNPESPCPELRCPGSAPTPPGPPPVLPFANEAVYYHYNLCPSGTLTVFAGTLPSWITLDTATGLFTGAAGYFRGNTVAEANALAQSALSVFVTDAINAGAITCSCGFDTSLASHTYGLSGYTDGDLASPRAPAPGTPIWGGNFITYQAGGFYSNEWKGPDGVYVSQTPADGVDLVLGFDCVANVPTWYITITAQLGDRFGTWIKSGGPDPTGIYIIKRGRVTAASPPNQT